MKEISQKLKQKREENGVSIEEASSDLKIRVSELENIERGEQDKFKDVLTLKQLIKDYAKYLGLDGEALLDEFNEYLFEQTSKISLEDIEAAIKKKEEKEKHLKILSPYTVDKEDKRKKYLLKIIMALIVILLIAVYTIYTKQKQDEFIGEKVSYRIGE